MIRVSVVGTLEEENKSIHSMHDSHDEFDALLCTRENTLYKEKKGCIY